MFTFRVLGTVDLRGPDGQRVGSVMSQPKRLALLALLAVESPRRLQRDEVLGMLWPEFPEDRARSALRQALHYLRRSLGPGAIAGKGAEGIGVVPAKLSCDVADLLRAVEEERWTDVMDLYQGELLPGFHLDGAPQEFEEWLDRSRRRVQALAADAARRLARAEESAGHRVAAGAAARKAWEIGDWGEPALQELLGVLVRTGDLAGAKEAYDQFAEQMKERYGAEPSAATRAVLEIGPTSTEGGESAREPASPVPSVGADARERPVLAPSLRSPEATRAAWQRWRLWWPAAAAVVLVSTVAVWSLLSRPIEAGVQAREVSEGSPTLILEPVRDLGGTGAVPGVAGAVTTELAARLSEGDGFRVVALNAVDGGDPNMEGIRLRPTLRSEAGTVHFSVLLLDASSGVVLDRVMVRTPEGESTTPETLVGRISPSIRQQAGSFLSLKGLPAAGISVGALSAVRGAAAERKAGNRLRARGAAEAAGLAYAAADSLLARAQELDGDWPEPEFRRAELAVDFMWLNVIPPNNAPQLAQRAILNGLAHAEAGLELAPESARGLEVRGVLRYWADQTGIEGGYLEMAERDLAAAVELDPGLPRAWSILSALSGQRGDFAAAYHQARQEYATDHALTASSDILARLFTNALEVGDKEGAAEWCAEIERQQPEYWLGPYCTLTHLAWVGPWDVAKSERLVQDGLEKLGEHGGSSDVETRLRLLQAVVLARAGAGDAARQVLRATSTTGTQNVDVLGLRAWVHSALGERAISSTLLATAAELAPRASPQLLRSRRFGGSTAYAVVRRDE